MKKLLLFVFSLTTFISCKDSSSDNPKPTGISQFTGKYSFSVKDREVGDYGAMDFLLTFTDKNGKLNVNSVDEFTDPSDMGLATVNGNSFTVKQHIDANYDTRDITITVTNKDGFLFMEYDVDFTQATGDFYVEGVLKKQ